MISLKQIQLLAEKVDKAVSLISLLKEENRTLKNTLEKSQKRIREFEDLINAFKNDQSEIEQTVLSAIHKLDTLEDEVAERPGDGEPAPDVAEETDTGATNDVTAETDAEEPDEAVSGDDSVAGGKEESEGNGKDDERQLDIF